MADRAATIARIQRIERIKELEAGSNLSPELETAAQEGAGKLETGLKALDYQRAASGGPAFAKALETLTGRKVLGPTEAADARSFKTPFPGSSEMMRRAGILTDGGVSQDEFQEPGLVATGFKPTLPGLSALFEMGSGHKDAARNVLGIGADMATDPLTYESGGASALARFAPASKMARGLNMALNPLEEFMKFRQAKNYKNAFKQLDATASKLDKSEVPSKILQEAGFSGNHTQAADALETINSQAGNSIGATLDAAAAKGATVHPLDIYHGVTGKLAELRSLGVQKADDLAKAIEQHVAKLWMDHPGAIPVDKANEVKTFLDHQIKTAGFQAGAEAPLAKQAEEAVSNTIRAQAPAAVAKVDQKLSEKLGAAMKRYASTDHNIVDRAKQLGSTVKELNGPFGLTAVDYALMGGGGVNAFTGDGDITSDPFLAILLAKKFGQAAMSTPGRTLRGKVAGQLASTPLLDSFARHAPRTVWGAMGGDQ